jgi:DNA-binding NtrC family response regulator
VKEELGKPIPRILVVDDEAVIRHQLGQLYKQSGYKVMAVGSAEEALEHLERGETDLAVTDIRLPGMSGIELTQRIQKNWPDIPVIAITGYGDIESAVDSFKLGVRDYIEKPFSAAAIQESTQVVLEKAKVITEIRHLRQSLKGRCEFGGMLSKTAEMHRVFEIIREVSWTDMTVVIEGETGTGKEMVASAIHYQSPRQEKPLVTINCAGFPESLLESELFGYERGAFTGADHARAGKIELAQGGTLFLDEIESMSLVMQSKLLLVLEDQKVQRLGGNRSIQVDMRVIAASNVPLDELVSQGKMRKDFYYRINVIPIHLIPLSERREDIPLLVQDFLLHHSVAARKGITGVAGSVMGRLMQYHWPGNVRELQNVLERAIVMTRGRVIEEVDLPQRDEEVEGGGNDTSPNLPLRQWLNEQEKDYLQQRLRSFGGKIGQTAKSCGMDVKTLYRKMQLHGLSKTSLQ